MTGKTTRRDVLLAGGTVAVAALAGCSGDDSIGEIETGIEDTEANIQAADPKLENAAQAIDSEDWQGCYSAADGIRDDVAAARESSEEPLALAEEEGHEGHAAVLRRMREYADILEEMANEIEGACEAGQNGDGQQLEEHWSTVEQLNEERIAKADEISDALGELQ